MVWFGRPGKIVNIRISIKGFCRSRGPQIVAMVMFDFRECGNGALNKVGRLHYEAGGRKGQSNF
jgi:hypothetical protein